MAKVVFNACYGGFSLSRAGILRAREITGDPLWGGHCVVGDKYDDGKILDRDFGYIEGVPRHDPVLVKVVEELGEKASGSCADLQIVEVEAGTPYRIDEYDGNETVATNQDYDWIIAP